jgi:predicted ATP-binding protein involved in virulence
MKLKTLQLNNFRCFKSLNIDLDEQLTVLVAKNGQGKSSVLDAIRIGLWPFVRGFDLARNLVGVKGNNISVDDIRVERMPDGFMARQLSPPCSISLAAEWNTDVDLKNIDFFKRNWSWKRIRESEARDSRTKDKGSSKIIKLLAELAQAQARTPGENNTLPVLGYYGTGRLWSQKKLTESTTIRGNKNSDFYMRLFAYRDCLDPASSYKHFSDWFIWVCESDKEEQLVIRLSSPPDPKWVDSIKSVQEATDCVLKDTGWHSLQYSIRHERSLILEHSEYGILKVDSLSDGIRGILAMVGDIAYRCVKLNPHLGTNAVKETHGIVMIDEVDMHLHPAWQQTILANLTVAFPNIQFIVTTHSPQVISTVPSHQIRILDEGSVLRAEGAIQGAEASRVLAEVFGVNPRPQNLEIVKKLNRYLELVDHDQWDGLEAKELRVELDQWGKGHEPELIKADVDIRMKAYQRTL